MTSSMFLGIFDWVSEFFKALFDLIPKIVYLLYASLASVLDVLQLFFRKLAGLDVYYVDGKAVGGDIVTNFITGILGINENGFHYSALTTVFWSFVVFGIVICFAATIISIVKSHYSYDEKSAKGPMQYVYTACKSIINIVAVPIIVVLGLYLSQAILTALDTMTSISSGNIVSLYGDRVELLESVDTVKWATKKIDEENEKKEQQLSGSEFVFEGKISDETKKEIAQAARGEKTYVFYDLFGFGASISYGKVQDSPASKPVTKKELVRIGSSNQTFSGSLFRVAAFNGNRARLNQMKFSEGNFSGAANNEEMNLFATAKTQDELADMIDTAFACHLHLKNKCKVNYEFAKEGAEIVSVNYFTNFLTLNFSAFSKFNIGLVWYYYDLWQFNFIVGFAGVIVCVTIFINIIMGLMVRIFMCIGLFLISPPLFGLAPLDGGEAGKQWKKNFMSQVLMAYGSVVGMNIIMLILPYMNEIDFFNILIADYFARTLLIIVGLITIKAFIAMISGFIGAADAQKEGEGISKEVGQVAGKATKMAVGTGFAVAKTGVGLFKKNKAKAEQKQAKDEEAKAKAAQEEIDKMDSATNKENLLDEIADDVNKSGQHYSEDQFREIAKSKGLSDEEARNMWNVVDSEQKKGGPMNNATMKGALKYYDSDYNDVAYTYGASKEERNMSRKAFQATADNANAAAQEHAEAADKFTAKGNGSRIGRIGNAGKAMARGTLSSFDTVFKGTNGDMYEEFAHESGIKKKPNYAKEQVEATKKMHQSMTSGFQSLGSSVNGGFSRVNSGVEEANSHLGQMESETADIKNETVQIKNRARGLQNRLDNINSDQRNAIMENRTAKKDLKKVLDNIDANTKPTPPPGGGPTP